MICVDCRLAGSFNSVDVAAAKVMHDKCEGDCGCQHKTGQGWVVKKGTRIPQMQVQSP